MKNIHLNTRKKRKKQTRKHKDLMQLPTMICTFRCSPDYMFKLPIDIWIVNFDQNVLELPRLVDLNLE